MAISPGLASGIRTLKSAAAGTAVASTNAPAIGNMILQRIRISIRRRSKKVARPLGEEEVPLLDGRRGGRAARRHPSGDSHQGADYDQRGEVENDLDAGRLSRVAD